MGQQSNNEIDKKKLPELLEEFREALEDEIIAAKKKSSSSAVPLTNGKRIAMNAGQYQYLFTIDSVLNAPEGSPAELIMPGKPPIQATFVSVGDLRIILSLNTDLGDFVPFARLHNDLSMLLKKLIVRIENNSEIENTVGLRMLGRTTVNGVPEAIKPSKGENINLNHNQIKAVESAIGRSMTFIWGPPGTGKTETIGKIIHELFKRNRTVLLVSHTNTAVDSAILKSAQSVEKQDLINGCILRLGIPKNPQLIENYCEVFLEKHIELHSKDLSEQLTYKKKQLREIKDDINKLHKQISNHEWCCNYQSVRKELSLAIGLYERECHSQMTLQNKISTLRIQRDQFSPFIKIGAEYTRLRNKSNECIEASNKESSIMSSTIDELDRLNFDLEQYNAQISKFNRREEIRNELSNSISLTLQKRILERLEKEINGLQIEISTKSSDLLKAKNLHSEASQTNVISRALRRIPSPERLSQDITLLDTTLRDLNETLKAKIVVYGNKDTSYQKRFALESELHSIVVSTSIKDIEKQYTQTLLKIEKCSQVMNASKEKSKELDDKIVELEEKIRKIEADFGSDLEGVISDYARLEKELNECITNNLALTKSISLKKHYIENKIEKTKMTSGQSNEYQGCASFQDFLSLMDENYNLLSISLIGFSQDEAKEYIKLLEKDIILYTAEIAEIQNKIDEIEKHIIADAKIIGTTLTKAYLSDELHSRKFDTIILDEASMAPIPALWVATLLSINNVVIVGDFKQLPPIVLSDTEIAKKWIGCDIFEQSGIKEKYEIKCLPNYFITLDEQHRMEPAIAEIANRYYRMLKSPGSDKRRQSKAEFDKWCHDSFLTNSPVVLVNTESLNAWVTSVSKGNQSSRLNFLSATLSVNLAERIISKGLESSSNRFKEKESKILIISPYRPHTKLIDLLLKDSGIEDDFVRAGTVHSFQGSEADIVIFDLVVDEPHFRVNLFMNSPEMKEQMGRLFNVAITRAKFKLFIIGDFKYCLSKGKKSELADLLNDLIFEKKFPMIDARELAPKLHEQSLKAQRIVAGGKSEPVEERLVVTQESFYMYLSDDLEKAKNEIVIYSPFMTKDRLSYLQPQLQAAIERGVTIFVITKSLQDRNKTEVATYREIEEHISKIGIVLIHKMKMHEKLVFIDDDIAWTGSLNPLSFSSTQEIMERRCSKTVQKDYKEVLRLSELINYIDTPESKCPICGSEMIAAEGKDAPYYWRCVTDNCFTRGIDQKYPMNGELTCRTCGGLVEFGYWGEEPSWRCLENKRHHMGLYRSHLKLPKMEKKISKRDLKKVSKFLDETYPQKSKPVVKQEKKSDTKQMVLFED